MATLSVEQCRFPRASRLTDKNAFKRVFDNAKRFSSRGITVLVNSNGGASEARLGMAISKKQVRRAVDRNRLKRLVRESFRTSTLRQLSVDVVVLVRTSCVSLDNQQILNTLNEQWLTIRKSFDQP